MTGCFRTIRFRASSNRTNSTEWKPADSDRVDAGLNQRATAMIAYLRDIYSDKQAIKDGIVPEEYVYTSAGYFP